MFALNILFLCCLGPVAAEGVRTNLSKIELLVDKSTVSPGSEFHIIFELEPNPGWHAYWENPGDAGLKLEMNWHETAGVEIGKLQFPTPHLIPFEDIISYGYDGKATIIAQVYVAKDYTGEDITLGGDAFWLICSDELCVPQNTAISTVINIGEEDTPYQRGNALVSAARADMPEVADWPSIFYTDGENFSVKSTLPEEYKVIESAYLFPRTEGMMENIYAQDLSFVDGDIIGRFQNAYGYADNEEFEYVLSIKTGAGEALAFLLAAQKTLSPFVQPATKEVVAEPPGMGFLTAMAFAFLGGLILNLMPCVFPILSLKAMSVAGLSEKDPKEARLSGLLYTAGVLICFGIIGAIVNLLSLGWGFHMQMPVVNFVLGLLMVVIGLNLFGVFNFGSAVAGMGQGLVRTSNRQATFFTGFLAVVVATPCTAPFMASVLGYAFISGGLSGWLVFLMLGYGLAFPYLLLCYSPSFRAMLPRPGAWMETMRTILGFPMLATALWLFWILGNQIGVNAMALALSASLLLGLALWGLSRSILWKMFSGLCMILVIFSGYYLSTLKGEDAAALSSEEDGLDAITFSSSELENLLKSDQAVFVYFTADWCVTCKLNERATLSQDRVHQAFEDKNITVMVGDWTNQNPDITRTLQRYGRIGVPLYLYFPSWRSIDNPDILPQILTPDMVIDAL